MDSGSSKSNTINQGPAPDERPEDQTERFEIAGNARTRGEKPSPGNRDRGETSTADPAAGRR